MNKTKPMALDRPKEEKTFNPEDFFGFLFRLRDVAHLSHLRIESFAGHEALGEFYKGILKVADEVVENWQGYNQKLATITVPEAKAVPDMLPILKQASDYFQKVKPQFTGDIQNILDDATGLCNRTAYKLRFLK